MRHAALIQVAVLSAAVLECYCEQAVTQPSLRQPSRGVTLPSRNLLFRRGSAKDSNRRGQTPVDLIAEGLVQAAFKFPSFLSAVCSNLGKTIVAQSIRSWPISLATMAAVKAVSDEGLRRSIYFWTNAFPVYVHYKLVDRWTEDKPKAERLRRFNRMHDRYADKMLAIFHKLGGFYIKIGQNGASREDFVPKQYTMRLQTLEDAVPAEKDPLFARKLIERSLGKKIEEVFRELDDVPLGSASIGQCHRGVLLDGREVVVKVMRPHVGRLFEGDVSTLESFCRLAQPQLVPIFKEIRRRFAYEFDYTREADNLRRAAAAVGPAWGRQVLVPRPIMELCRRDVLVMDYLPGVKLVEAVRRHARAEATRRNITLEQLQEEYRARESEAGWRRGLRRAGERVSITCLRLAVGALRMVERLPPCVGGGAAAAVEAPEVPMPLDPDALLDKLLRVHAHMLFDHGVLNGDPHPGNVLLVPDGRLGLIDFGQLTVLNETEVAAYARLVVSLADRDDKGIVEAYTAMGMSTRRNDPPVLRAWATILNDRDDPSVLEGHHFQSYMEELQRRDPVLTAPEHFVFVQQATVLLRGCGHALGRHLSVATAWAPYARACLARFERKKEQLAAAEASLAGVVKSAGGGVRIGRSVEGHGDRGGKEGKVIVICGPSGVGKGTIIARLLEKHKGRMGLSVSHTSRKPRPGEKEGVHYHFSDKDSMLTGIKEGLFLEHAEVHGNIYGTSYAAVEAVRASGRTCLVDIDVQGVRSCRRAGLRGTYVFVAPPSLAELERRLRGRATEEEPQVLRRLRNARLEVEAVREKGLFDHVIVNDKLSEAVDFVSQLV